MNLTDIRELDSIDPFASYREQFQLPENKVYLDGNSLGAMTKATATRLQHVIQQQWSHDLISSWNDHNWIHLPLTVGEKIGRLIGAEPGQTICCDSISVNLFKALAAALSLVQSLDSERNIVVSTKDNFPTDLYMVQGVAQFIGEHRCQLKLVEESELEQHIDDKTAVVLATEVNFRTGKRLNAKQLASSAHEKGALVILDLAHSAGAMPVHLDDWHADFAVGCTYKYLNGGPGAPAFIYAAKHHHKAMAQPLNGWFGHARPFDFTPEYEPAEGIQQMLTGTPSVIAMAAVDEALNAFKNVSLEKLREKSLQLSDVFHQSLKDHNLDTTLELISPQQREQRGSQLSYYFEHAYGLCQALIQRGVIADFRAPNYIRFGFTPLYTSFEDVWHAAEQLQQVIKAEEHLASEWQHRNSVT
ncbi:kynureninase [Idiomarina sp. HP20-50]|uniref:kynureninase n=1 Tax=Idiomarina sp. HP20-50 TaxID=3070813 RepID=UPI00294B881F|nr:kynureninase [Idiomarina sp. HP20-50]MDV6315630.1 kynureninase [Idiomarina sp. HP20-50]